MLCYAQDDELEFIASQTAWDNDPDYHCLDYQEADLLIDSAGAMYSLTLREGGNVSPKCLGQDIELALAISLVQAHFAQLGTCCISKISAHDVRQLIGFIADA